jgi:hypothetical protein
MATYNIILERFYDQDEDQVRGLIAYGLYKVAKREWATQFHVDHQRLPTEAEVRVYHATWTDSVIASKRAEADVILASYADEVVNSVKPGIVEEALRGSTGAAIRTNLLSNFIYTLLLIGAVVILEWSGVDLLSIAQAN